MISLTGITKILKYKNSRIHKCDKNISTMLWHQSHMILTPSSTSSRLFILYFVWGICTNAGLDVCDPNRSRPDKTCEVYRVWRTTIAYKFKTIFFFQEVHTKFKTICTRCQAWYVLSIDGIIMPKHVGVRWLQCHTYGKYIYSWYIKMKYWFKSLQLIQNFLIYFNI
jgi:hypothetical protein